MMGFDVVNEAGEGIIKGGRVVFDIENINA